MHYLMQINIIYDGLDAETMTPRANFKNIFPCEACRTEDFDNLQTSLKFHLRSQYYA